MSKATVKTLSRKIDHYLRVQRYEDCFDLSQASQPILSHPKQREQTLINTYTLLDSPLKYQFQDAGMRVKLRRMYPQKEEKLPIPGEKQTIRTIQNFLPPPPRRRRTSARVPVRGGGLPLLKATPTAPCSSRETRHLVHRSGRILAYLSLDRQTPQPDSLQLLISHRLGDSRKQPRKKTRQQPATVGSASRARRGVTGGQQQPSDSTEKSNETESQNEQNEPLNEQIERQNEENEDQNEENESLNEKSEQKFAPHIVRPIPASTGSSRTNFWNIGKAQEPHDSEYKVYTVTGDRVGAGTDAAVTIELFGTLGSSGPATLGRSRTHCRPFRRGHVDEFDLDGLPDVGDVNGVCVGHDSMRPGDDWFLQKVVLHGPNGKQWTCDCDQWLSAAASDRRTRRELPACLDSRVDIPTDTLQPPASQNSSRFNTQGEEQPPASQNSSRFNTQGEEQSDGPTKAGEAVHFTWREADVTDSDTDAVAESVE